MADNGQFAFQQQTVTYDARNRIVSIRDPRYDITYEYDALGNRRHMRSVYTNGLGTQLAEQDYWYQYDSMSRFTISMGQLSGARATAANGATTIVRGTSGDGVAFTYTQAGLRAQASYAPNSTTAEHTESYYYDGRGLLNQTRLSDGSSIVRTTDLGGRVTTTKTTDGTGKVLQNSTRTWTKDNQLLQEHDNLGNKGTKYELLADGTVSASQTYSADAKDTTTRTSFTYDWWDSAKQTSIGVQARNSTVDSWKKVWQPGFSQFTYDVNGHSKLAYDEEGKRAFTYWTDTDGQVLKRQELIGGTYDAATGKMNGASKAREHGYYYLDGHRIGDVGNDQTERADYAQELTGLRSNDGRRSYEKFTPSNAADFDANYQPINSDYPAATPTAYTVRAGDTLQSVARALWGDATLWYMLAEANGLIGTQPSAALTLNSTLVIPNQVTNIHNTSATFKPYNPGKALGDTMPTLPSAPPPPPPPSKGGCGGIGQILTIVVIIVATVFTAGAASLAMAGTLGSTLGAAGGLAATMGAGMTAIAGGSMMAAAVGAAVGSVVGQGFAIATGQQENFSWRNVGLSALGGAVSAGIGGALQGSSTMASIGQATNQMGQTMAQAAIGNIATQSVMTATGLQNSFDWRGVAVSAAAAGVGYAVGKAANTMMNYNPQANGQGFDWGKQFASNTVSGIAAGATYAKLRGDDVNAGRLIAGSAVYGAASASLAASISEQKLLAAQQQNQEMDFQRDVANRRMNNPVLAALREQASGTSDMRTVASYNEAGSSISVSMSNSMERVDTRPVLYINNQGEAVHADAGGYPVYGLERRTNFPVQGVPQYLQPADASGLRYSFDSAGQAFWRTGDTVMSIPAPYIRPALSDVQGQALWSGFKDGITQLPENLVHGVSELMQGNVGVSDLAKGIYESSPIGMLDAMAHGGYYRAGQSMAGNAAGVAGGMALNAVARPMIAAGSQAVRYGAQTLGPVVNQMYERYLQRSGLAFNIVPEGPTGGASRATSLPNLMTEMLQQELAVAKSLGISPMKVTDVGFGKIAAQGPVKWAVLENGNLVVVPKFAGVEEIKHSVLSGGKPVLAAGEATVDVFGNAESGFLKYGNEINRYSGHFEPPKNSLQIGVEAFKNAGIHFKTVNPKLPEEFYWGF